MLTGQPGGAAWREKTASQPSVTEKRELSSLFVKGDRSGVSVSPQTACWARERAHTTAVTRAPGSSAVSGSRNGSERALTLRRSSALAGRGRGERPLRRWLALSCHSRGSPRGLIQVRYYGAPRAR